MIHGLFTFCFQKCSEECRDKEAAVLEVDICYQRHHLNDLIHDLNFQMERADSVVCKEPKASSD